MKKLIVFLIVVGLFIAGSGMVSAAYVEFSPDLITTTPGSTVNVSVNLMDVSDPITMTAISAVINYDTNVFTYLSGSGTRGALLPEGSDFLFGENAGEGMRGGAIFLDEPYSATVSSEGVLFSFVLQVNNEAEPGSYNLSWGDASGGSGVLGLDYGDENFVDVVLESYDGVINVSAVPIPGAVWLFGSGLIGLVGIRMKAGKSK